MAINKDRCTPSLVVGPRSEWLEWLRPSVLS